MKQKRGELTVNFAIGLALILAGLALAIGIIIVLTRKDIGAIEFLRDLLGFR